MCSIMFAFGAFFTPAEIVKHGLISIDDLGSCA